MRLLKKFGVGAAFFGSVAVFVNQYPTLTSRSFPPQTILPNHDAPTREDTISRLRNSSDKAFDVLVIGGGATGSGCALDATLRGLHVALVEGDDFASGTSCRSTKLIHGGVRYLEKAAMTLDLAQLKLVYEALRERTIMIHQAPHLCNALPTMLPCYHWWEVPFYYVGLKCYDIVAASSLGTLQNSYALSAGEAAMQFPTIAPVQGDGKKLYGAIVYYDGQMNDARLNVSVALTAACHGASVVNHTRVTRILNDEKTGKVIGARVKDQFSGEEYNIYAKAVVNATGPHTDEIRQMADKSARAITVPSAGVHITLPDYYSPKDKALIVPKTKDGRVVFMVPWLGQTIAGTTDTVVPVTSEPRAKESDVQFILESLRDYLALDVKRTDVQSVWCGIRPLARDPTAKTSASILREHSVIIEKNGIVTITGGKWTTYRKMAEDAIDAVLESNPELTTTHPCSTQTARLFGAHTFTSFLFASVAQNFHDLFELEVAEHLARSYGDRAMVVGHIARDHKLSKRLDRKLPVLEAEVRYCAENEYAETAVDFLTRRSRMAFLNLESAVNAVPRVVEIMGDTKKWSKARRAAETKEAYRYLEIFTPVKN
jgi:glycerol-3-phosphate dehydrogenase